MADIEMIKKHIKRLYEKDPNIHIDVSLSHPKLYLENAPAVIKGVYSNLFRIEEERSGYAQSHSLQYADVLIGRIRIRELDARYGRGQ